MTIVQAVIFATEAAMDILAAARDTAVGKITPDELVDRMQKAVKSPKSRDAKYDAQLEEKFADEGGKVAEAWNPPNDPPT